MDAEGSLESGSPIPEGEPQAAVGEPPRTRWHGVGRRRVIGPFTARHILAALGTLVLAAALLAVLTVPLGAAPSTPAPTVGGGFFPVAAPTEGLRPGQKAPELSGEVDGKTVQLVDLDGSPIRLADLRGRPIWVNFWATWCPPCQEETPTLQKVYERHRADRLALIAISVQETTPEDVRSYARTYGLTYTIGFDATSAVFKTYRAYGLPTQLFIDRDGIIRNVWKGPLTDEQAEAFLASIL
jgi:cytochrome c biogenesis protein CcmG/thiol:disulfide interchange protein DsbE